jgi:hypothetical protein
MKKVKFTEINLQGKALSDIIFLKNQNLWLFLSQNTKSRYFGLFLFYKNQVFRILDEINFLEEIKEIEILNPDEVILIFENNKAHLKLTSHFLKINFTDWANIALTFDIKEIFNNDPFKRKINFRKYSSFSYFIEEFWENKKIVELLITYNGKLLENNFWKEKLMDFDQKRNSPPFLWWVYDGLYGKVKELTIEIIYPKIEKQKVKIFKKEKNKFLNFLLKRIEYLFLDDYLPAGFPWFFENWYRDELLSLFLLKNFLENDFFEKRINFYLKNLNNLWNKNKNNDSIAADTLLLIFLNLPEKILKNNLDFLNEIFQKWQKDFKNNLSPLATWMDTLERKNAIEIDALYLKALEKFSQFKNEYSNLKEELKEKIKNKPEDINLVFVYLFTSELFSQQEWENLFDKLLNKNFLDWGGLSSLSRDDSKFLDEDDGETAKAYHSGDSWYFLNNLAAFCLKTINEEKFSPLIQKIIQASLEDLFFYGALGWSSEISSAKERKSQGSLVQLWSLSSLVFLFSSFKNINVVLKSLSNSHNIISIKS